MISPGRRCGATTARVYLGHERSGRAGVRIHFLTVERVEVMPRPVLRMCSPQLYLGMPVKGSQNIERCAGVCQSHEASPPMVMGLRASVFTSL